MTGDLLRKIKLQNSFLNVSLSIFFDSRTEDKINLEKLIVFGM